MEGLAFCDLTTFSAFPAAKAALLVSLPWLKSPAQKRHTLKRPSFLQAASSAVAFSSGTLATVAMES